MNLGQNFLDLIISNAGPLVTGGLIIGSVVMLYKRKLTEFIALLAAGIVSMGIIYNPTVVKDFLSDIFVRIIQGIS